MKIENIPLISKELIVDLNSSMQRKQSAFVTFRKTDGSIIAYDEKYNPIVIGADGKKVHYKVQNLYSPEYLRLQPIYEKYFVYTAEGEKDDDSNLLFLFDFDSQKYLQLIDDPEIKNVTSFIWSKDGTAIYFISPERDKAISNLYRIDLDSKTVNKIVSLNSDIFYLSDANSNHIVLYEYISNIHRKLYLYDLKTSKLELISKQEANVREVKFSSNGKNIYYLSDVSGKFYDLYTLDIHTKIEKKLNKADLNIRDYALSDDENKVVFKVNYSGGEFLRVYDLKDSSELPSPQTAPGVIENFSWKNNSIIGFTYESLRTPPESITFNTQTGEQITIAKGQANSSIIDNLSDSEIIKWKSFDDLEISGIIVKPKDVSNEKLPVIIDIHGGPQAQYQPYYSVYKTYPVAKLNAVTIFPQIRGSSGFGKVFENLDNREKREDAIKDIEALVDWVSKQPEYDSTRIILKGESYGAFVALAVALRNQDKVKAVIAERPVISLKNTASYEALSKTIKEMHSFEYGDPKDLILMSKLEQFSVLAQLEKWTGKVPIFFAIGANDSRVPVEDVEILKDKLKEKGFEVWFMKALNEGHSWNSFENNVYLNLAEIEFLKNKGLLNIKK